MPADTGAIDVATGLIARATSAATMTATAARSPRCSGLRASRADAGTTSASPAAENAWTSASGATARAPMCSTEPNRLVPMPSTHSRDRSSPRTVATGARTSTAGAEAPPRCCRR